MQVIIDGLEIEGEHAIYRWTLIGTNTGPGGSGNRVRICGSERWLIGSEGLIARSQGQFYEAEYACRLQHGTE